MKKLILLSIFLCSSFLFLFAQEKCNIGLLLDDFNVDRWYKDRDFFVEKIKDLNCTVKVEVAYSDTLNQLQQAEKLLAEGVEVLVIVPVNGRAAAEIVKRAKKSDVKVISYDRLITNCDLDYYISFDNVKVGELQASYLTNIKPKGNYIIMSGPHIDNNSLLFREGQQNILQPYINKKEIKIILDIAVEEWTDMEAFMIIDQFLSSSTEIVDAIIAANDGLAKGVIDALELHNSKGYVLVTGQDGDIDACKLIAAGSQTMTVYKPIKMLAHKAAEIAVKLYKKENDIIPNNSVNNGYKNVPTILLTPIVVDKGNLRSTIIPDNNWDENEIF